MSRKLVAYFSAGGTTRKRAEELAEKTGADIYEIRPANPYSNMDLDWTNNQTRTSVEMNDPDSRPPLAEHFEGLDGYDSVYIGFPIWWYTAPHIINSFIEDQDMKGKKIALFATSGGSSIKKALEDLSSLYKDLDFAGGDMVNSGISEKLIEMI